MARFWPRRRARTTEERVERVPPPQPRPFWPWLLLLLLLVLAGLAAAWYLAYREDTVEADRVPNLIALQQDEAERRLDERGFEDEVKPVESTRPTGTVVEQRPEPGTLYGEGGIVVVSVARDPNRVEVPGVTRLRAAQAQTRLREAGLQPRVEQIRSPRPRGLVLRQIPDSGTEVPRGSTVVVIASAGRQLVEVPDVVSLGSEDATAQLARTGFRTRVRHVPGSDPEGTVVAQQPRGGSKAPRGGLVQINVSRGPTRTATTVVTTTQARTTVPNTLGQDEPTATSTLQGAGFQVRATERTVTDPANDGLVIRQEPAGGTSALPGSTVTITVGRLR